MNIYVQKSHQRAFGTYPLQGEVALNAILAAAEIGYRAFDTAQMYENEAETGEAEIKKHDRAMMDSSLVPPLPRRHGVRL